MKTIYSINVLITSNFGAVPEIVFQFKVVGPYVLNVCIPFKPCNLDNHRINTFIVTIEERGVQLPHVALRRSRETKAKPK